MAYLITEMLLPSTIALSISLLSSSHTANAGEKLYRTFQGVDLRSPCLELQNGVHHTGACALLCSKLAGCRAGSFNSRHKTCCLSDVFAYEEGAMYEEDDYSVYFQLSTDTVEYGNWTLAFRALAASGFPVYDKYTQNGFHDDYPLGNAGVKLGCVTLNGSRSCDRNFRSAVLDKWDSLNITEVRLSLYTNETEVLRLMFDGYGSTANNWLDRTRVLESPWDDLVENQTYNSFGIQGKVVHHRRFFINRNYGGCASDKGWLCVTDVRGPVCPWEYHPLPAFLYSKNTTAITWQLQPEDKGVADVLAVFVKF